jgi:hypothetical protein
MRTACPAHIYPTDTLTPTGRHTHLLVRRATVSVVRLGPDRRPCIRKPAAQATLHSGSAAACITGDLNQSPS